MARQSRAELKARIERSKFARASAMPARTAMAAKVSYRQFRLASSWLVNSREHTNLTYELTALNTLQLEWFIANVAGCPVEEIRGYVAEIQADEALRDQIRQLRLADPEWRLSDPEPHYGRRLAWYALVRALKPMHVVETGTDKGLGAMVLGAAVLANGHGRVTTIDTRPHAGYLIGGKWAEVIDFLVGDSNDLIGDFEPVDLFIHSSQRSAELQEYETMRDVLTPDGIMVSDNAHVSDVLIRWGEENGRTFTYFQERPDDHWYPGAGMGISLRAPSGG